MKKQTAMILSFSALLAIGAMAPHVLWQADNSLNRTPASVEQKDLFSNKTNKAFIEKVTAKKDSKDGIAAKEDGLKFKDLEKVESKTDLTVKEVVVETKKADVDAQVSCLKEKQPADLEAQIKKLMEDKEAIVKELADLKKAKKEEPKVEDKKEDKKKVAKTDNTEDVLGIMSQLTGLMVSQQQQQMMMMNQMFSMFQMQMPKQQSSWYSPMSDYMSPYAFNASAFEFPRNESPYSLGGFNNRVGLNSDFGRAYSSYDRAPAQMQTQMETLPMFDIGSIQAEGSFQPQILTPRPHNGFQF